MPFKFQSLKCVKSPVTSSAGHISECIILIRITYFPCKFLLHKNVMNHEIMILSMAKEKKKKKETISHNNFRAFLKCKNFIIIGASVAGKEVFKLCNVFVGSIRPATSLWAKAGAWPNQHSCFSYEPSRLDPVHKHKLQHVTYLRINTRISTENQLLRSCFWS